MKYKIQKLDGRYAYHQWFQYYIWFSSSMNFNNGPLEFTKCQLWCFQTWGWSAEIRMWSDIHRHYSVRTPMMRVNNGFVKKMPENLPNECNTSWSWTNGARGDNLRIYLATEKELAFFQLAHPNN